MDPGNGAGAETGLFLYDCVGNTLPEHPGYFPPFRKLPDLCLREQVAEKLAAFIQTLQPVDRFVQIVNISGANAFHALPG